MVVARREPIPWGEGSPVWAEGDTETVVHSTCRICQRDGLEEGAPAADVVVVVVAVGCVAGERRVAAERPLACAGVGGLVVDEAAEVTDAVEDLDACSCAEVAALAVAVAGLHSLALEAVAFLRLRRYSNQPLLLKTLSIMHVYDTST